MSLLKLAPDSERLRRVARAYAAGELDENEYRRIRSEVIDRFAPETNGGDDTQQRWTAGVEQEPANALAVESQPAAPDVRVDEPSTPEPPSRLGWVAAATLLVAGALAFVLMA